MLLKNRNLLLLSLTSFLNDISSEMVYPLLPLFLTSTLGASPSVLGLIEGIAESIAQFLRVFAGAISDRLQRRKPLTIAGYAASVIGKALLYFASAWGWVFAARLTDRFGKGVRTAPRDALLAESVPPHVRGRAFGIHRAADTAGATLGILIALGVLTWATTDQGSAIRTVFLLSVIPAALSVVALIGIREPERDAGAPCSPSSPIGGGGSTASVEPVRAHPAPASSSSSSSSGSPSTPRHLDTSTPAPSPFRHPLATFRSLPSRLKAFLLITFLFNLGNSSNQFLLLRAGTMGFDTRGVVLLYLVFTLIYLAASYPAGHLSDHLGRRVILVAGYAVYGLTYLGFGAVTHLGPAAAHSALWGLFAVYGLYTGLTDGVEKALLADLAPKDIRATVMGLNAAAVGIALLPASALAGILWDAFGPAAPFYLGGALGLSAAIALWKLL